MATIEKRGDKYRIKVPIGKDEKGRRLFESMIFEPAEKTPAKIKKEVEKAAGEFEERVKKGLYIDGDKITFGEYIKFWREQWAVDNLTVRGLEDYERLLENRGIPALGRLPIGSIRPTHLQGIVTNMKREGKSPKTIKRTMTAINSVLRYAYDMEVIEDNPMNRVRLPKIETRESLHYFTAEQTKTFFEALKKEYPCNVGRHKSKNPESEKEHNVKGYTYTRKIPYQWRVYFDLAITGAFRRGELIAIKWIDVDWKEETLSIKRAFSKTKKEGQIVKYPKTESGIRTITLPRSSLELLKEWYSMQKELCLKLGTLWEGYRGKQFDENYVFIQLKNGLRMDIDSPTQRFRKIIDMYNATCEDETEKLPIIRLHDLRHTSATLLLSNGADIETVSHRLGHKQCSITLDIYAHWMEENDKKAADILENLLQKKPKILGAF